MFHFSNLKGYGGDKMDPNGMNGMKDWNARYRAPYNPMDYPQVPLQNNLNHHAQHGQRPMSYMQQHNPYNQTVHLNPNAEVFVPRSQYKRQPQFNDCYPNYSQPNYGGGQSSYQQQNYNSNNMANYENEEAVYEAMYGQFGCEMASALYVPTQDLQYKMSESQNSTQLNEIQVGLEQLVSGDDFDSWSLAIKDRMACPNMSDESRNIAIAIACEMAIAVSPNSSRGPSPQFIFARLLAYLDEEIPGCKTTNIFPTLQKIHTETRALFDIQKKCDLLMFFGEVFLNLRLGNGAPVERLGGAVFEQIEDIIKEAVTNESMNAITQVLKLCGSDLDSMKGGEATMNQILTKLSGYVNGSRQLDDVVKTKMTNVIETRQRGWVKPNRSGTGSSTSSSMSAPVGAIIGPDGHVIDLTDEERMFLESQFKELEDKNSAQSAEQDPCIDENDFLDEYGQFIAEEKLHLQTENATVLLQNLLIPDETSNQEKVKNEDNKGSEKNDQDIPPGIEKEKKSDETN